MYHSSLLIRVRNFSTFAADVVTSGHDTLVWWLSYGVYGSGFREEFGDLKGRTALQNDLTMGRNDSPLFKSTPKKWSHTADSVVA